jgi:hypothetical protein
MNADVNECDDGDDVDGDNGGPQASSSNDSAAGLSAADAEGGCLALRPLFLTAVRHEKSARFSPMYGSNTLSTFGFFPVSNDRNGLVSSRARWLRKALDPTTGLWMLGSDSMNKDLKQWVMTANAHALEGELPALFLHAASERCKVPPVHIARASSAEISLRPGSAPGSAPGSSSG